MTIVNPIIPPTALLRPQMPGVYLRSMIYDPTYSDPSYNAYVGQRIIPAVGSVVQDIDETPLWVIEIDSVTFIPTYQAIPLSTENDNVVSMLNYGNTVLRLYTDYRHAPYPATPDSKCIFIGKSPRFYTLTRYPRTNQQTVISQYYDNTGTLVSTLVPLRALDDTNTSWYLQRGHINQILDDNEEIEIKVFNEDGAEVASALMFAKTSTIINEAIIYTPTIVGLTVTGNQQLTNGTFFLYEKQDFDSLGIRVTVVYDDGNTVIVPIDNLKCLMYGQNDFIASFAGLTQYITIKYFRSENESISASIADGTGAMISTRVPVTVIPNTLGTTAKIMAIPYYNSTLSRYIVKYFMYFGDGRSAIDVSGYVTLLNSTLHPTSTYFGISQTIVVKVDMHQVDPAHYSTSTIFQQTIVLTLNVPNQLVKYIIRDSDSSQYVFGLDNSTSRRPSLRWDRTRAQMFVPSYIFGNTAAFLDSFYYRATPPYDPSIAAVPQEPTHFLIRDMVTGNMLISTPIPIASYAQAFTVLNDVSGDHVGSTVIVEFINRISSTVSRTLFGVPVDVTIGTYIA